MNNKRKVYLALVFLLIFNSTAFGANNTSNKAIKKVNASISQMDFTRAVIHHSASKDVSASVIDKWHKEKGWEGIGYHFVIRQNGQIEKGRNINKIGAHAKGRNNYIGICLTGYDTFTVAQIKSLITLLNDLGIQYIERHHEECPGKGINLDNIRKHLESVNMRGKASYYNDTITANGERFYNNRMTCATLTENYGMKFKVTNIENGKCVVVRNNDHGPHKAGRVIDLTQDAFKQIANLNKGIINVKVETIR